MKYVIVMGAVTVAGPAAAHSAALPHAHSGNGLMLAALAVVAAAGGVALWLWREGRRA
ncbi:hypothetical protein [Sagittula sp. SSi028]|uniref:hypothetical protein n=1 Tax=Sagittula sp. SSi028 TaxID=3400636 RepID=UPI003AF57A8B